MKKPEIKPLTTLRFFAALWVVVFHFLTRTLSRSGVPDPIVHMAGVGFLGVPLFFVLSGFILWYSYADGGIDGPRARRFWVARLARVYPLYMLAFVASVIILGFLFIQTPEEFTNPAGRFLGLVLSPFLLQAWVPSAVCTWNCPDWSLSVEATFYLLFPFLTVAALRWRWFLPAFATLATLVSLTYIALFVSGADVPRMMFFNPLGHMASFAAGMLLGRSLDRLRPLTRWAPLLAFGGFAGIIATTLVIAPLARANDLELQILLNSVVTVPCMLLLVAGLAILDGPLARLLSTSPLVLLGNASYAIYLLQYPVLLSLFYVPAHWVPVLERYSYPGFALTLVTLVAVSIFLHRRFELPARQWVLQRFSPAKAPAPAPADAPAT